MTRQIRLLKVLVQTVWVEMDDETGDIVEHVGGTVAVPAADWPTFYERHTADFAALQRSVAAESNGQAEDVDTAAGTATRPHRSGGRPESRSTRRGNG